MKPYQLAFEKNQELKDIELWTLGRYVMEGISACFGKHKYPEKPYGIKATDEKGQEIAPITDADRFSMFAAQFNRKFDNK